MSFELKDTDWYSGSDTTYIMIREATYDVRNTAPAQNPTAQVLSYFESLEGEEAPYIMIYYTIPSGWEGTIFGEENPAGVFGESVEDIETIWGE